MNRFERLREVYTDIIQAPDSTRKLDVLRGFTLALMAILGDEPTVEPEKEDKAA